MWPQADPALVVVRVQLRRAKGPRSNSGNEGRLEHESQCVTHDFWRLWILRYSPLEIHVRCENNNWVAMPTLTEIACKRLNDSFYISSIQGSTVCLATSKYRNTGLQKHNLMCDRHWCSVVVWNNYIKCKHWLNLHCKWVQLVFT